MLSKKKIDIDEDLSEKLLAKENATRFVNDLVRAYLEGRVVMLSDESYAELERARAATGKECEVILNELLGMVEIVPEAPRPKLRVTLGGAVKLGVRGKNYVRDF